MKFSLTPDSANELYQFAKAFIDPKCYHDACKLIACEISNDVLTATMVNLYSMCKIMLPTKGEDGVCFIAPPQKKFSLRDKVVIVNDEEAETRYITGISTQIFPKSAKGEKIYPYPPEAEPKARVWVKPSLLVKSLKAFSTDYVKIDVFSDNEAIRLSGDPCHKAIVMPCHPPKGVD